MRDAEDLAEDLSERSLKVDALLSAPLAIVVLVAGWAAVGSFDSRAASAEPYPIRLAVSGLPIVAERAANSLGARLRSNGTGEGANTLPVNSPSPTSVELAEPADLRSSVQVTTAVPRPVALKPGNGVNNPAGFLVSDFDLGSGASSANAIDIRKAVLVNGGPAGTILVRIGAAAQVYVRQSDLSALLAGKLASPFKGDAEFITLDQIRDHGVNVHYNASKDELLITT